MDDVHDVRHRRNYACCSYRGILPCVVQCYVVSLFVVAVVVVVLTCRSGNKYAEDIDDVDVDDDDVVSP